jgi:hypothetical protein
VAGPSSPVLLETIDVEVQLPTGDSLHMQFPPDVTLADIKGQVIAIMKYASPQLFCPLTRSEQGVGPGLLRHYLSLGGIVTILMYSLGCHGNVRTKIGGREKAGPVAFEKALLTSSRVNRVSVHLLQSLGHSLQVQVRPEESFQCLGKPRGLK